MAEANLIERGATAGRIGLGATVLLLVCCAIWGFNQVAIKVANQGFPPVMQAAGRSVLASGLLVLYMRLRGQRVFVRDGTLGWGALASFLFGLEFVALYIGLNLTAASRGVLLLYVQPIVVALGVHFFAKGDRLTATKTGGLVAAFVGVGMALLSRSAGGGSLLGDLLCFAAGVGWGLTIVVIKAGPLASIPAERVLLYQLAGSIPVLTVFSWGLGERLDAWPGAWPLAAFLFTTIVVSFASYLAYFWLLTRYQASRVSAFTFLVPVLGVAFGAILLHEPISALLLVSLALVTGGIYLVNRS